MADRRKPTTRNRTGSVDKNAAGKNSAVASLLLPNIAELIAHGEITVGVLRPIGCVATATDDGGAVTVRGMSAAGVGDLAARHGITLHELPGYEHHDVVSELIATGQLRGLLDRLLAE